MFHYKRLGAFLFAIASVAAQDASTGIERYKAGDYAEAESALRRTVDSSPDDAPAHLYLGLALLSQDKISDAEKHLKRAHELDASGEAKAALARYYAERKDFTRAEAMLDGAEGTEAHYARGLVEFNKRDYEAAARELESFLETHPSHAYARYYAGMAYNGTRRPDKMLTHLEIFLQKKPSAREARAVRAILKTGR